MKFQLRNLTLAVVFALAFHSQATAAVILTSPSYVENFDSPKLPKSIVNEIFPTGAAQASIPGTTGWDGAKIGGVDSTAMGYSFTQGASVTGAIYCYSANGANVPERALGALATENHVAAFGVEITNSLGTAISQVTISYVGEFWRRSTIDQEVLSFAYSVGAPGSTNYLTSAASGVTALNLVGPAPGASQFLNGNVDPNRASFMATFDVAVPVGQSLYLRWQDTDNAGSDAGLAVDDFQLTAVTVPEPASAFLLGICAIGIGFLRRRNG